jgi:hypothetical protein
METDVFGRLLDEQIKTRTKSGESPVSITTAFKPEFDVAWNNAKYRLSVCPPKQVVSALNLKLQRKEFKPVSISSLARGHRVAEIPQEPADLLRLIESRVEAAT